MKKFLKTASVIFLFINGTGALWGGAGLIYDPTGDYMQMPLSLLEHSPFHDYLVPGIILFIANGLFSMFVLFMMVKNHPLYARFIFLQGVILAMWITVQVAMLQILYLPLHLPFFLVGVFLIIAGIIISASEKTPSVKQA